METDFSAPVTTPAPKRVVTPEHRQAMTQGRKDARAVRDYLKALSTRPGGRTVNVDTLRSRLTKLNAKIDMTDNPLTRVALIQSRLDLEQRISDASGEIDMDALERDFIRVAREYSANKGITWAAWREVGVPAAVLKATGLPRGGAID